jgi:hypothetical protein
MPGGTLAAMSAARLPELDVARVQRWCAERVPQRVRHQVRLDCDVAPGHLTIVECRAPWREDLGPEWTRFPIARLRYTKTTKTWRVYWRDRNLRFHAYDRIRPSASINDLLAEIDRDPTGIFWG